MASLLAIDNATDHAVIALHHAGQVYGVQCGHGAQGSAEVLPAVKRLLADAGLSLHQLDAMAVGIGPGAFTGLRVGVGVIQGLAYGAGLPVVPLDSISVVATDACLRAQQQGLAFSHAVIAIDARLGELFAQAVSIVDGVVLRPASAPELLLLQAVPLTWFDPGPGNSPATGVAGAAQAAPVLVAGSGAVACHEALVARSERPVVLMPQAGPSVAALGQLALQRWQQGLAVPVEQIELVYVRDKVAQTIAERQADKREKADKLEAAR